MKKVLSFVLVLSMILGSFGMAFAAAPSDVVGKDYEDAVNVLMELGVVEGYKDGTYRPEKVVTRAEMATLIIKALGRSQPPESGGKQNKGAYLLHRKAHDHSSRRTRCLSEDNPSASYAAEKSGARFPVPYRIKPYLRLRCGGQK